ncbi:MAG: aminotransferase class I/II-fold pyridoxal phosphate-dependent enzyme [Lachnospiraceae bacterium]|nr:aminotransferase class I/II-fold pyridoxal phosphate-dependent enzyme [Lachnospiraceae bacterium]
MNKTLDQQLKEYATKDYYPFHMPGHKRTDLSLGEPSLIDITEINGFDDLHHPTGLILETERAASRLWGVKRSFLLVNGSTVGILAGISAALSRRDTILIGENCHKSVKHACFLNELQMRTVAPVRTSFGIPGQITPEAVEQAFSQDPGIKGVVITSPTYEGIVSDIASIAEIVHRHDAVLIVDEAHGAHFGMHRDLPVSAVTQGADLVVQSLHKTLPSLTQTAVLHLATDRIPEKRVSQYLDIFETSSPSYVLMAGMSRCIRLLTEQREPLFSDYLKALQSWYQSSRDLKTLSVLQDRDLTREEAFAKDPGKLVIRSDQNGIDGYALADCLRDVYHLETERVEGQMVICMTSICDRTEGFRRLSAALHEIDADPALCRDYVTDRSEQSYDIYRGDDCETWPVRI